MIGYNDDKEDTDFSDVDETPEEETLDLEPASADKIPDIGGDTMVDVSAELKVDEIVARIDATNPDEAAHAREVRRRLEEIQEEHDKDLDSTFNFNLDDDL